ncbi:MAG: tRNA 2-thiocytidine biosynthesis TtcA family protein, partial [Clostridium sp.]
MQKLLSKTRQAINDFNLIQDGDKVAVGLSGGKDSLTLLHILRNYQKFAPQKFELIAITLNPGGVDNSPLYKFCEDLEVPFYEVQTDIKEIVFDIRKEKNPCSLCAKLRRGILHEKAKELNCNKLALGHHKDDAIETFAMAISYEGRVNCFSPKSYMDKVNLTLIRPMVYIEEYMTIKA